MSSMLDLPHPDEAAPAAVPVQPTPHLRSIPDVPLDFEAVARRLTPRLQRYATRRLGDRHEAEELVQEALLRAFDHRDELRTEEDVAAWSTCVTGRLVIDRLRVRGRSTYVAEVPEGTRVGRDTADVVVARDEARLALDALDAMPSRQAAVLWAREVEGLAYDEIGARFGMTEPAVRSVLSRARKALRKEFATRGGTLPAGGLVALAPWLDGLGWLDRLRRVALRAATPAALGAVSLGVLGGALILPSGSAPEAAERRQQAIASSHEVAAARATVQVARPAPAAAPVDTRSDAGRAADPGLLQRLPDPLVDTGVNDTCASASQSQGLQVGPTSGDPTSVGAGGAGCGSPDTHRVQIGPDLPDNPTGVTGVGVESSRIDCGALPSVPLTSCTTSQGENR